MKNMVCLGTMIVMSWCTYANIYYEFDEDFWVDPSTGIGWSYVIEENAATVTGVEYEGEHAGDVNLEIPSVINGFEVKNIGKAAFSEEERIVEGYSGWLESVVVPEGVTNICTAGFFGCTELSTVSLPSSLICIGQASFKKCERLRSLTIPEGVKCVGMESFGRCGLESVSIPSSLDSIGVGAFSGCRIEAVEIPLGVKEIGSGAFYNNFLKKIVLPSSITSVGANAFSGYGTIGEATVPGWQCTIPFSHVTNLVISSGTLCISNNAFNGCSALTSVTIPSSVVSIGDGAFISCVGLASVTIPSSVAYIGRSAFENCGVETVTIPSSVASIGEDAFARCFSLMDIFVSSGNPYYSSVDGILFSKDKTELVMCPIRKTGEYVVPNSVTNIGTSAFSSCSELTALTIPASVLSIGSSAFRYCSQLASLTFEGNAPAAGDYLLQGTPINLVIHAADGSTGWTTWNGRTLSFDAGSGSSETYAHLTVTNVIIHYIVNSVQPEKVIPASSDTGFVNIITEVKSGGAVSVPTTWAMNYPTYVAKFGADFTKSLMKPTGKKDGSGNAMLVWQDYVAGTDPTDEDDVFSASITMDADGNLVISYSPELTDAEKALRVYKTWGKVKLQDTDWVEVPEGHNADYNFFKVSVEMK